MLIKASQDADIAKCSPLTFIVLSILTNCFLSPAKQNKFSL